MSISSWWRNLSCSLFGCSKDNTEFFGKRLSSEALKIAFETIKADVAEEHQRIEAERRRREEECRRREEERRRIEAERRQKEEERRKKDASEVAKKHSKEGVRYSVSSNGEKSFSISAEREVRLSITSLSQGILDKNVLSNDFSKHLIDRIRYPSFSQLLVRYVTEKCNGRASLCYERCGVSRQVYSKIISHPDSGVAKRTVMQLCIGLQLSHEEADEFMKFAGYSFSPSIYEDVAFLWCLDHAVYNIFDLNELLVMGDCTPVAVY